MIKCDINKKGKKVRVTASGTGLDISLETLAIISELYKGFASKAPESAEKFRLSIIAGVIDPNSPVWEKPEEVKKND